MCSTAGPDAEENGTDGTAGCGATWQPSDGSAPWVFAGSGARAVKGPGRRDACMQCDVRRRLRLPVTERGWRACECASR